MKKNIGIKVRNLLLACLMAITATLFGHISDAKAEYGDVVINN